MCTYNSFGEITGTPVLDVWWCLSWVSNPAWISTNLLRASIAAKPSDVHTWLESTLVALKHGNKCVAHCELFLFGKEKYLAMEQRSIFPPENAGVCADF